MKTIIIILMFCVSLFNSGCYVHTEIWGFNIGYKRVVIDFDKLKDNAVYHTSAKIDSTYEREGQIHTYEDFKRYERAYKEMRKGPQHVVECICLACSASIYTGVLPREMVPPYFQPNTR